MAFSDIFTWICEGTAKESFTIILPIATFIFYFAGYAVFFFFCLFILDFLSLDKKKTSCEIMVLVSGVLYLVLLICTPFTEWLFEIDENNIYSRGRLFFVPILFEIFIYGNFIIYLIVHIKRIDKNKLLPILAFLIFPQIMQIIQLLIYGVSLINTGFTMSFLTIFLYSNRNLEESLNITVSELDIKENELGKKESEVEKSRLQIINMQNHTIESLSNLVENRDEDTGEHVRRTRTYVELLALQMMKNGYFPEILTPRYIRFLKRAAPMHDIGKIVVPDHILKKPGRLTEEEFKMMQRHASEGGRIVHEILDGFEDKEYIQIAADIASYHHEKWDGTGYPFNLKGEEIPLGARIMALADVFDALVSPRVYKEPMSYETAFAIIESGSGSHFDPAVAGEFLKMQDKAIAVNESFKKD
ncbi:MAG: HD domain-containing protein [Treponema sp.]|nr:HD domain-containing protein [Treponema sp.]